MLEYILARLSHSPAVKLSVGRLSAVRYQSKAVCGSFCSRNTDRPLCLIWSTDMSFDRCSRLSKSAVASAVGFALAVPSTDTTTQTERSITCRTVWIASWGMYFLNMSIISKPQSVCVEYATKLLKMIRPAKHNHV